MTPLGWIIILLVSIGLDYGLIKLWRRYKARPKVPSANRIQTLKNTIIVDPIASLKNFLPNFQEQARLNTFAKAPLIVLALIILFASQKQIASTGLQGLPVSLWLEQNFQIAVGNLDNIIGSLPTLLIALASLVWLLKGWNGQPLRQSLIGESGTTPKLMLLGKFWIYLLAIGICSALLVSQLWSKNYLPVLSPVLWITTIFMAMFVCWNWDQQQSKVLKIDFRRIDWVALLGLILLGLIVGTFRLSQIPNYLIGDEGGFFSAARLLSQEEGSWRVFDFGVYTYPLLSTLYQMAIMQLVGIDIWGWRFTSMLAGLITVVPLYLLVRELFDRKVAWVACVLMISLPYYLSFTRLGYNNSHTLPIVTAGFYCLYLGLKRGSAWYLIMSGIIAGLGFYTYTAARSALVMIGLILIVGVLMWRGERWKAFISGAILGAGWALVAVPHLVYGAAINPEAGSFKIFESLLFNEIFAQGYTTLTSEVISSVAIGDFELLLSWELGLILIFRGFVRTLLSFLMPQMMTDHFISAPLAGDWSAVFFLAGIGLAVAGWRQTRYRLLLGWILFTIITLSTINTFPPRYQHMVGIIPAIAVLSAIGLVAVWQALFVALARWSKLVQALTLGAMVFAVALTGLYNYFVIMPQQYKPAFDQLAAWSALQNKATDIQQIYIAPQPIASGSFYYFQQEFGLGKAASVADPAKIVSGETKLSFDAPVTIFAPGTTLNEIRPALDARWSQAVTTPITNREGAVLGYVLRNHTQPILQEPTLIQAIAETLTGPMRWWILLLSCVWFISLVRLYWRKLQAHKLLAANQ